MKKILIILLFLFFTGCKEYEDPELATAKRSAAKSKALAYIDSITFEYQFYFKNGDSMSEEIKNPVGKKCVLKDNVWTTCGDFFAFVDRNTRASLPNDAIVRINKDGRVVSGSTFTFNEFKMIYVDDDIKFLKKS